MLKQTLNTEHIRKDFPILQQKVHNKPLIYLDNAATSQKPSVVIDALTNHYTTSNANIHRGIHKLSELATLAYEKAHQKVADFIGAHPEEIIFTKGTTESINLIAHSLGKQFKKGDEIVISIMEHHSNLVPWQQLAKEKELILKFITITSNYHLDMNHARELITQKTRLVSITHMSNVLGTINPVKELATLAHKQGALLVIDGAQAIPHLPINVKELDCDFYAFSAHKMYGPTGLGVLYGKQEHLNNMQPYQYGGDMIKEVTQTDTTWNDLPWKFEAGTPAIAEAAGLTAAIDYLQKINREHLIDYEEQLTQYTIEKLKTIKEVTIIGPADTHNRGSVISFTVKGIHAHDLATILDRHGIAIRGGHHCAMPLMKHLDIQGSARASLSFYNTFEEIDHLINAIKKAQDIFT